MQGKLRLQRMNVGDEKTRSLWMDVQVASDAVYLDKDEDADTVVIGGGITGLSTAYELAAAGRSVVVLDRGTIGMGMTARTTAHLSFVSDDDYSELIDLRGLDQARAFLESHATAVSRIEQIQQQEGIDCDFRRLPAYLFPAEESDISTLEQEYEAGKRVGLKVEWADGAPLSTLQQTRCLLYPSQATFHPLKYLRGLAAFIRKKGGRFYSDTRVDEITEANGGVVIKTSNGRTVRGRDAVVATNSPINDWIAIHTKQAPYRTYVVTLAVPKGKVEDALFWDTQDPYHYARLQPGTDTSDFLIVGGEDHKTGQADDAERRYADLEAWTRKLFPQATEVTHRWSGQVLEPIDYAAFIGRNPGSKNIYVATGDSGQGITHGIVASLLISRLILEGKSPWTDFYDPSRKPVSSATRFISENATMVKNLAEYVTPGELSSVDDLKPAHGAIIRQGLKKVAAYRDENGKLSLRSAVCTHAGCHVQWNSNELCWDCPCHGSQFAPDGTALNGPAVTPLAPVD